MPPRGFFYVKPVDTLKKVEEHSSCSQSYEFYTFSKSGRKRVKTVGSGLNFVSPILSWKTSISKKKVSLHLFSVLNSKATHQRIFPRIFIHCIHCILYTLQLKGSGETETETNECLRIFEKRIYSSKFEGEGWLLWLNRYQVAQQKTAPMLPPCWKTTVSLPVILSPFCVFRARNNCGQHLRKISWAHAKRSN